VLAHNASQVANLRRGHALTGAHFRVKLQDTGKKLLFRTKQASLLSSQFNQETEYGTDKPKQLQRHLER
jgi:hypothetical protein